MKYLFKTLVIFLFTFLVLKFLIFFFNTGHEISYSVGNFSVEEKLSVKDNEYYFNLTHEDFKMSFDINQNYNKDDKVISKVLYKKVDDYYCVLPIFKNGEILTDVMCLKDNVITYAHDIKNDNVNKYVRSLKKYGYDSSKYLDKASPVSLSNTQILYEDNILENNYVALESYKGLNLFNGRQSSVKIFDDDIYKKPISYFTGKYYIVADYTENYTFKIFHVVNIVNGSKFDIRSYDDISFDSYIEGSVDDDIYLFDKDANVQYKISLKNESVEKFHDKDNLKTYNGKWEDMSLNDAINGKKFNNYYSNDIKGFDKVDKVGNYYYLYRKNGSYYDVYYCNKNNKNIRTYLFKTSNIDSVIYFDDVIYYQKDNMIYYYSNYGSRRVLSYSEFEFNSDLSFGVYKK